jgi:hypothetical protein
MKNLAPAGFFGAAPRSDGYAMQKLVTAHWLRTGFEMKAIVWSNVRRG